MRSISPIWALKSGQAGRPGRPQILLLILWTGMALLVGTLGTFSIPLIGQASLFWPAMVFQTVGGLWFGGLGILSAVIFPLLSNALGGFPWPQNLAWISGNLVQGGLLRLYFQSKGWDPSLPSGKEVRGFIAVGAILSNILGVLVTMTILGFTPYGLPWSTSLTYSLVSIIGNGLPCILLGLPLLKIFSPLITRSPFFFPRLWQVKKTANPMPPTFKDFPMALKLLIAFFAAGFLPMAILAAFSVSEEGRQFNVFLLLALFLCIILSGAMAKLINTSLMRIKKRLREIGQGDFKKEFHLESRDELGDIGDGIQEMALKLDRLYAEQETLFLETILSLAEAIDARDPYTRGHSDHVSHYALETAKAMGLLEKEAKAVFYAAILHDIGKIGIREDVLNFQGSLDQEKYEHMKTHPELATRILGMVRSFDSILPLIRGHHERYDGSGYPDSLKGEEIPRGARIIAVADVYDALTTDRPYRTALNGALAKQKLKEVAGTQFDPQAVEAFLSVMNSDRSLSRAL
ncbi:MAG: HD domain-containing phosphohydrolase [Thermodesulfobacteriota bacterium]